MPGDTFCRFTATQVEGLSAVGSFLLTAALVSVTAYYALVTRRIANNAEEERRTAAESVTAEQRTALAWALSSMKQSLLEGDFKERAFGSSV
ncbi:MAG TPA: hypothetical protein VK714_00055 [Myxococcota bacterium]|nr:hypothetical protein [Myxococcota bacterium]